MFLIFPLKPAEQSCIVTHILFDVVSSCLRHLVVFIKRSALHSAQHHISDIYELYINVASEFTFYNSPLIMKVGIVKETDMETLLKESA